MALKRRLQRASEFVAAHACLPQYTRERADLDLTVQRNDTAQTAAPHHNMTSVLPNLFKTKSL
jgi:hypothetical protein